MLPSCIAQSQCISLHYKMAMTSQSPELAHRTLAHFHTQCLLDSSSRLQHTERVHSLVVGGLVQLVAAVGAASRVAPARARQQPALQGAHARRHAVGQRARRALRPPAAGRRQRCASVTTHTSTMRLYLDAVLISFCESCICCPPTDNIY